MKTQKCRGFIFLSFQWDKVSACLEKASGVPLVSECLEKVAERAGEESSAVPDREGMLEKLSGLSRSEDSGLAERTLRKRAEAAAAKHEEGYVKEQKRLYVEWEEQRQRELERQFDMYQT